LYLLGLVCMCLCRGLHGRLIFDRGVGGFIGLVMLGCCVVLVVLCGVGGVARGRGFLLVWSVLLLLARPLVYYVSAPMNGVKSVGSWSVLLWFVVGAVRACWLLE
jgi:hypothetical protein